MKKILCLLLLVTAVRMTYAQQKGTLKISDMTMPSSPGFILADKAPSAVEKPVNPAAFGISLINLWQGGAIDVTPYWLTNKPKLTFENYIRNRFPIIQTFNISAATFKTDSTTSLSAGFRTQLFKLYYRRNREAMLRKKEEIAALLAVSDPALLDTVAIAQQNKALREMFDVQRSKGLIIVELAGAIVGDAPNNTFRNLSASRSGLWTNIRWSPWKFPLDFVALGRYSRNAGKGPESKYLDYGLSANYQRNRFDLSVEYVNRRDLELTNNYDRLAFAANFMINENFFAVAAFGKNFDKMNNIIALLGVKFAISKERVTL
ncbi:hypothetical protein [Chitinophaga nivalis]|uniref:DUF3078 domain-containing protein n=1 Tax=Chitinophaga nivalis TaxID=2991709 RepID=A0ABT3IHG8_9BACT|nr:hypothetical protein [Chitinophaga nivalis]MCW3466920.1 hypothetical protein [Chitinophaga nivalis]MCW3483389.1 hypothetical protein [Chitinophaga nivalis]